MSRTMIQEEIPVTFSVEDPTIFALVFRRVGDSLMATPALRQLHLLVPHARIAVLVEEGIRRVFENNPAISEIISIQPLSKASEFLRVLHLVRRRRPDAVLDFLSDPRSALLSRVSRAPVRVGIAYRGRRWAFTHLIACQDPNHPLYSAEHKLQLTQPFGNTLPTDSKLDFFIQPKDEEAASQLWVRNGWDSETSVIAMAVHSRRVHKRWPEKRFAKVARRLIQEYNLDIALLAGPGEELLVRRVLDLIENEHARILQPKGIAILAACLGRCRLLIGNDGGPKHLAVAVGTPTLTLFGADPFQFWTPPQNLSHIALSGSLPGKDALLSLNSDRVFNAACALLEKGT